MTRTPRRLFKDLFQAAIAAADPLPGMAAHLPERPAGRTVVVGAGKAAARMAAGLESLWPWPLEGAVVTPHGNSVAPSQITVLEAGHPVPDQAGLDAARLLQRLVSGLGADDLVIALISGGGSALLPAPAGTMTLEDEIAVNRALLASGAPIADMNAVRKHISTIKGGRLAALAYPARVVTFVVSDIPGDDPALVSSAPTIASHTTREDSLKVVETYGLDLPEAAMAQLRSPEADAPLPGDLRFTRNEVHLVASAAKSLEAAASLAKSRGIEAVILSDAMEGEAREVGRVHAAIACEIAKRNRPFGKPVLLLSGGETTVTLGGSTGRGGRNTEFLLALAIAIDGVDGVHAFAADTDGIDGSGSNAGAFADSTTVARLSAKGLNAKALLAAHDSWQAFDALGDLFSPGPTGTNVNDFRAMLVR